MATNKIIVIDDSKVIRMKVKDMLPAGNFEILEAKDGAEGLNLIQTQGPTLILLDFILPKMSGWEVYQELQKEYHLQAIPLVLMSGKKEEVTDKLTEPFEFFSFVEKPFEKKQLMDAIKDAMVKARKRPPAPMSKATIPPATGGDVSASEVHELKMQVAKLTNEVENLKKQLAQVVKIIQQKLK